MILKVASFELLEFLLSPTRHKYYVIALAGSPAEAVTKANYSSEKIIVPELPTKITSEERREFVYRACEKDILQQTNLRRLIRRNSIDALSPDTYSDAYFEGWTKRNKIHVVCTPYRLQKKFENKLFFDRFLHKHRLPVPQSRVLKSVQDIGHVDIFPVILQTPSSSGSAGTFFIRDRDELMRFTSINKKVDFPLLCRQFIDNGIPIGVSVLVGPKRMLFSAIRMQAYFTQPDGKNSYYGIQWIKTSSLNPKAIEKLNKCLNKAGTEMQKSGFLGIAAFDLIVRGEDIYFIECNPRTGGSTPQMASRPELLHDLYFTDEYVRIMTGAELSAHRPFIPDSNYEGFTLDFAFLADLMPKGLRLNTLKCGIYSCQSGHLSYLSAKVADFSKDSNVFVHYIRPDGFILKPGIFVGFLFTHFPLLGIRGMEYNFSEEAVKLLKHLEDILIKK